MSNHITELVFVYEQSHNRSTAPPEEWAALWQEPLNKQRQNEPCLPAVSEVCQEYPPRLRTPKRLMWWDLRQNDCLLTETICPIAWHVTRAGCRFNLVCVFFFFFKSPWQNLSQINFHAILFFAVCLLKWYWTKDSSLRSLYWDDFAVCLYRLTIRPWFFPYNFCFTVRR